jgi:hypothetical protein
MTKFIIGDISTFPVTADPAIITGSLKVSGSSATARIHVHGGTGGDALSVTGSVKISGNLEVTGTSTTVSSTHTLIKDKIVTLNDGGGAGSGGESGIEIEEDGSSAGYIVTSGDRAAWKFKVPAGNIFTITPSVTGKTISLHDDTALNQNLRTTDSPQFLAVNVVDEHPRLNIKTNSANGDGQIKFIANDSSVLANLRCDNTGNSLNHLSINAGTNEDDLVVHSSGKIGIGTTTPDNALEVLSSTAPQMRLTHTDATDYATFAVDGDGQLDITTVDGGGTGGHICLMPDGYVGVGTGAPEGKLHVLASSAGSVTVAGQQTDGIIVENDDVASITLLDTSGGVIYFGDAADTDIGRIGYRHGGDYANSMYFWTNNAQRMTIDSSGRVGVGLTEPDTALHVSSSSTTEAAVTIDGGMVYKRTAKNTSAASVTYTILESDYIIGCNTSTHASRTIALTLPTAASCQAGQQFVVKDEGGAGGVGATKITIGTNQAGSETLDGAAPSSTGNPLDPGTPYFAATFYTDGSNWFIY